MSVHLNDKDRAWGDRGNSMLLHPCERPIPNRDKHTRCWSLVLLVNDSSRTKNNTLNAGHQHCWFEDQTFSRSLGLRIQVL